MLGGSASKWVWRLFKLGDDIMYIERNGSRIVAAYLDKQLVRSGCQLRAVPCKRSWPLHRVWAEAVGGRRCAALGTGNSLFDKPVTNADQAAQSLATMRRSGPDRWPGTEVAYHAG
jgi:hypothetical protein